MTVLNPKTLVTFMDMDTNDGSWFGPRCIVVDCNVPITSMEDLKKLADSIAGDSDVVNFTILSWCRFEDPEAEVR